MFRLSIAAFAISLMAASCGQKGPLYLPESSVPQAFACVYYNGSFKEQNPKLPKVVDNQFTLQPYLLFS